MRNLTLALLLTCIAGFSNVALAQAAAEAALTHAMSSATGTAMGTQMGRVTNQMAGKLGQQTSNAVRPALTTNKAAVQRQTKVPRATTQPGSPKDGSMIASIQGAVPSQASSACTTKQEDKNGSTGFAVPPEERKSVCPAPAASGQDIYHSVITLPAAK